MSAPQPPQSVPPGWEVVEETGQSPTTPVAGNGVPEGWTVAEDAPAAPSAGGLGALSATAAAGAAAIPAAKWLAEHIATSPTIGRIADTAAGRGGALLGPLAAGANPVYQGYQVATGQKSLGSAVSGGLKTEATRQAAMRAPGVAARVASALGAEGVGGMAAPVAVPLAGGLAGLAGSTGFLAALQHDANRHVDIDYSKDTPDTAIARVFSNMRDSEANRGKTLDQRQDDPNDVMFQPDESVTVRGGAPAASPGMLQRLALLAGLR